MAYVLAVFGIIALIAVAGKPVNNQHKYNLQNLDKCSVTVCENPDTEE